MTSTRIPNQNSDTAKEQYWKAVIEGNVTEFSAILKANPSFLNMQDVNTGRTALHETTLHPTVNHSDIYCILLKLKADKTIRDYKGFTAIEIIFNREVYKACPSTQKSNMRDSEIAYFIEERNGQLEEEEKVVENNNDKSFTSKKIRQHFELVCNTQAMVRYVKNHPQFDLIGFLVKTPNVSRDEKDIHHSPILYVKAIKTFIQIDSIGRYYLIPQEEDFKSIYSPISYQVSGIGCAQSGLRILIEIMNDHLSFLSFLEQHIEMKLDSKLLVPLSGDEEELFVNLNRRNNSYRSLSNSRFKDLVDPIGRGEKKLLDSFIRREAAYKQHQLFDKLKIPYITSIKKLKKLPVNLLPFTETYNLAREARISGELGKPAHFSILKRLIEEGQRRTESMKPKTILDHLNNPNKLFDIAGKDYKEREKQWSLCRKMRYITVSRLFRSKFAPRDPLSGQRTLCYTEFMDPKKSAFEQGQQRAAIIDRIASFATETKPSFTWRKSHKSCL